jgi:opine dehydrogenase
MIVTVIGAGNSGLAMAAHLSQAGHRVNLWNRSRTTITRLMETHLIYCEGVIHGAVAIDLVTDNIKEALENSDIVLITTPANSHKELAELIAGNITRETLIVLNPGRTFGALEFQEVYRKYNSSLPQTIAETQTIIYTCRKTAADAVNIITFKDKVLIASLNPEENKDLIHQLPECLQPYFIPATSMIQTSIGNVGMVLHCAPLLLNTGWTESKNSTYKYYYDGITPSVAKILEHIDEERVQVSEALGLKVETTREWLMRTYHVTGNDLYECIQNNEAYKTIEAPGSLKHRYIFEDVPCGLVPLEAVGLKLGLSVTYISLIIDLAVKLLEVDFRKAGRNLFFLREGENELDIASFLRGEKARA